MSSKSNKRVLGNILLILTAIIWGSAFVSQRMGTDGTPPMTFTASRTVLSAVFVGVLSLFYAKKDKAKTASMSPEERAIHRKHTLLGGLFTGLFLGSATIFQQIGIAYTTAGKAGFITAMYILVVPIINIFIFKNKSQAKVWIAVFMGVVGMYLLCVTEDFTLTHGDFMVLVCALLFTGHILSCDHFAPKANPILMSEIQFIVAAVMATVGALLFETPSVDAIMKSALPILYCGILSGGVGYTLQIIAQRYTEPTTASLLMSSEAVFAVLSGAIILGERMSLKEGIGCVILFAAIILIQIPIPTKQKTE